MKIKVYNLQGQAVSELELSDEVFGVKIKPAVVHQVYVQQMNNQREPWADTLSKGEVSGGGKKPWQQKGTGRARHGSIRSPIWKGGGVSFGPRTERNYKTKINKKIRRLAIKMCLSDKVNNNELAIVDNFSFAQPKTKLFSAFLKTLPLKAKKFLVLTSDNANNVVRMAKNIANVNITRAQDVNVMDLLRRGLVITTVAGIKQLEATFNK